MSKIAFRTFPEVAAESFFAICSLILVMAIAGPASAQGSFSIVPGGGQSTTNGGGEQVGVGYVRIRADEGSNVPRGAAVIELRDGDGVLISEIGIPATEPVIAGRLFAEVDGAVTTVLAIANPGAASAAVRFRFTDGAGIEFADGELTLDPGEQVAAFLDQAPFNGGVSFAGSLHFDSSTPVAVNAVRGLVNEAGEFLLTAIPVATADVAGFDPVYFPYFTHGAGWSTDIVLSNPTDRSISGTLGFFGQGRGATAAEPASVVLESGAAGASFDYAIPPWGHMRYASSNPSAARFTGSARVIPDSDSATPDARAIVTFAAGGKTLTESAIVASQPGSTFRVYTEVSGPTGSPGTAGFALALANTGGSANTVNLELTDLDGLPVDSLKSVTLSPWGQTIVPLEQLFSLPEMHAGVLHVSARADLVIAGVRLLVNERGELKISTAPTAAESFSANARDAYFPLVVGLEGFTTRYVLFDGSSGGNLYGALELFDSTGRFVDSGTDIGAGNEFTYSGEVRLDCADCGTLDDVTVVLSGSDTLRTAKPDETGAFEFFGLAAGDYIVQVRKEGFRPPPARSVRIADDGSVTTEGSIFPLAPLDPNVFEFHWEEDQSTAGYVYSSHVNEPVVVEFLGESAEQADGASADDLLQHYNIRLIDHGEQAWTHEHAYRLLRILEAIPQQTQGGSGSESLPESRWLIASGHVVNDIRMSIDGDGVHTVWVSPDAFVNARPRLASIEGRRGTYYSNRLHRAAVRFVTDNGRDVDAYEKILQERYGVTTLIGGDAEYLALTAHTTAEPASRFQPFHAEEIVEIINMFEEMPSGMRVVEGLGYLVRRLDGTPNPIYSSAPAIAWVTEGYIEFMDAAFLSTVSHMHRLVVHEKAHFLWEHVFDEQLKADWIELGGWYPDPNDPDGWSTTKQTEFVSAYAHGKNPNEDMAESISFFLINPDKLRSRALGKFEFVRDRIMQGNIYLSQIREDLTFQVYNLYPDYVFPGKIRQVDIVAHGGPLEDKEVTVTIGLHALDRELEGAALAYTRIYSEIDTYYELNLIPLNGFGEVGTILSGTFTMSKYAKAGYWRTDQIRIFDEHRNARLEGFNDYGWSLHANNPLEDVVPPGYVANSASLNIDSLVVEGREVQVIEATWSVDEAPQTMGLVQSCFAVLNDDNPDSYKFERHGEYDPASGKCKLGFIMPHYMPSSVYRMEYIRMTDQARNINGVHFRAPDFLLRPGDLNIDELAQEIHLTSQNPDLVPPELDISNIRIDAEPTQPENPNGETLVTLDFRIRDNISGFVTSSLILRDPQGIEHQFWINVPDRDKWFPENDPTEWTTHTWNVTLPAGSAPGIWGMSEMVVWDRAENFQRHDFTEIVHFDVEGGG